MLFEVWAPKAAKNVTLHLQTKVDGPSTQHALTVSPRSGWWSVKVPEAKAGDLYTYSIDGGEPRPDPRSAYQPQGVHGPSAVVDHDSYKWQHADWRPPAWSSAIVYELHIGTFSDAGTYHGATEHLDKLVNLGITHVELLPVNQFSGRHGWGYDGAQLFAPHQPYGSPDDLKALVDACHSRGLAVLLDVVYNHLGPTGNYLGEYGPYFTTTYKTPWGDAVNLDGPHSHEVRKFFTDNARMWLRDYRFDGLRIDAVHAFLDQTATPFMEELVEATKRLERQTRQTYTVIFESDLNDPRLIKSVDAGGYGAQAQWSDDFHHAVHRFVTGESSGYYGDFSDSAWREQAGVGMVSSTQDSAKNGAESPMETSATLVARVLETGFIYAGQHSPFRNRVHGRSAVGLPGERLLAYIQNHDQIGNRARGERITHLCSLDQAQIAAALTILSPFVPMLFQGEEWGASTPFPYFSDHQEEWLADAVRQGRRREFAAFGWQPEEIPDPQAESTFKSAKLLWNECNTAEHKAMLEWYRSLIRLRRANEDLGPVTIGSVLCQSDGRCLRIDRHPFILFINAGNEDWQIDLDGDPILTNKPSTQAGFIGAGGVAVYKLQGEQQI